MKEKIIFWSLLLALIGFAYVNGIGYRTYEGYVFSEDGSRLSGAKGYVYEQGNETPIMAFSTNILGRYHFRLPAKKYQYSAIHQYVLVIVDEDRRELYNEVIATTKKMLPGYVNEKKKAKKSLFDKLTTDLSYEYGKQEKPVPVLSLNLAAGVTSEVVVDEHAILTLKKDAYAYYYLQNRNNIMKMKHDPLTHQSKISYVLNIAFETTQYQLQVNGLDYHLPILEPQEIRSGYSVVEEALETIEIRDEKLIVDTFEPLEEIKLSVNDVHETTTVLLEDGVLYEGFIACFTNKQDEAVLLTMPEKKTISYGSGMKWFKNYHIDAPKNMN